MRIAIRAYLIVHLTISQAMIVSAQQKDTLACDKHSCCCSTDPTPSGIMISHIHQKKEWMIAYKYMNMYMNGLMQGDQHISKDNVFSQYVMAPENMRMDMHMLMAMYGVTNKLTLMGMLNYNSTSMQMSMFTISGHHHPGMTDASGSHNMESSGLGDLKLYALYGLINKNHHQVLASVGMSIPTGNIKLQGDVNSMMYPGSRLPYAMQTGSGTVDLMPCVNYLYQHEKLTVSTQFSSTIRTGYNSLGYKLGNELTWNSWFAYQWLNFLSSSVRVEGNATDKISGSDPSLYIYNEPSANPVNYGGKRVTTYIGSVLRLKQGFVRNTSIGVEYGLPVYQYWNGTQMGLKRIINVSLSVGF